MRLDGEVAETTGEEVLRRHAPCLRRVGGDECEGVGRRQAGDEDQRHRQLAQANDLVGVHDGDDAVLPAQAVPLLLQFRDFEPGDAREPPAGGALQNGIKHPPSVRLRGPEDDTQS